MLAPNAGENGTRIMLAILGRHRTDGSNQFLETACQEAIQFEILGITHLSSPTFPADIP